MLANSVVCNREPAPSPRAMHGHFLVQAALVNKLMLAVLPCQGEKTNHSLVEHTEENHGTSDENPTPEIGTSISSELKLDGGEIQKIHDLYEGIQDKSLPVSIVTNFSESFIVRRTCG